MVNHLEKGVLPVLPLIIVSQKIMMILLKDLARLGMKY
jgi:hypothetical protein